METESTIRRIDIWITHCQEEGVQVEHQEEMEDVAGGGTALTRQKAAEIEGGTARRSD